MSHRESQLNPTGRVPQAEERRERARSRWLTNALSSKGSRGKLLRGAFGSALALMLAVSAPMAVSADEAAPVETAPAESAPAETTPVETEPVEPAETAGPRESAPEESTEDEAPLETEADPDTSDARMSPMAVAGTRASCSPGTFYNITYGGRIYQVASSATGQLTTTNPAIGSPAPRSSNTQYNGLAIGSNGSTAYAFERGPENSTTVYRVATYNSATGQWTYSDINQTLNYIPIAGAADPATGAYLVGGYGTKTVSRQVVVDVFDYVWYSYYPVGHPYYWTYGYYQYEKVGERTETQNVTVRAFLISEWNPTTRTFTEVGWFESEGFNTSGALNGDMAFDAAGNLFVVTNGVVNGTNRTGIFSVKKADLDAARATAGSGEIPAQVTRPGSFGLSGQVNGLAFNSDGQVWVGSANGVWQGDPSNWTSSTGGAKGWEYSAGWVTDLASCSSPPTLQLIKDVTDRYADGDQFHLIIERSGQTYAENTTTGDANGIQPDSVGPVPVMAGQQYTIRETDADYVDEDGNLIERGPIDPERYEASYQCSVNGTPIAGASGELNPDNSHSATITIPKTAGAAVRCVITNTPKSELTVRKQWVIDGEALPLGATPEGLPEGYVADLELDGDIGADWNETYRYDMGETVTLDEKVESGRCEVESSVQYVNGEKLNAPLDYDFKLEPGSNSAVIKNEVTCDTKLTLIKQVEGGDAEPTEWDLTATDPSSNESLRVNGEGTGEVEPDTEFTLAEEGGPATYVQDLTEGGIGAWTCTEVDADGNTVESDYADAVDDKVTVPLGAHVQCTTINRTSKLTVLKEVPDDLEPAATFTEGDFTLDVDPGENDYGLVPENDIAGSNVGSGDNTFEVRPGHTYEVSEKSVDPNLAYVNTQVQYLDENGDWHDIDPSEITLEAGQHLTIRFVNVPPGSVPLPLTGGFAGMLPVVGGGAVLAALAAATWYVTRRKQHAGVSLLDD